MKSVANGIYLVLFMVVLGIAQGMGPMEHCKDMGECKEMCQGREMCCPEIDVLTPEQRTKVEDIRTETRKAVIPIRSQIELKQIDLQGEMKSDNPNKDKIIKISKEIHELEWQIKKLHLEEKMKIHSLLTPEQREKLKMHRHRKMIKEIEIKREHRD